MRKLRKFILILIIVPAVLYGAVKGYLWYTINSQMEALQKSLQPVARLSWREILTPMLGPIGVKHLVVRPHIVNDPIQIGSILIHANDPMQRFELISAHLRDEVPKKLVMSINRVSLDLNGEIANWIGKFQKGAVVGTPIDALACGDRQFFTIDDLRDMGYKELATDINLQYSLNDLKSALDLFIKIRTHDMMEFAIDALIPASEVPNSTKRLTLEEPSVESLSVTVRDLGYNKNKTTFCSVNTGKTPEQYIQAHVEAVRARAMENGFEPSAELMRAFQQYLTKPSTITLAIRPIDASPLTALRLPDSNDAIKSLGLEVSINDKPVENIGSFQTAEQRLAALQAEQEENQVKVIKYRDTPIPELVHYLDQRILIDTTDGKFLRGYLNAVAPDKLVLTRQLVGGSATFAVATKDIERVRVLR